MYTVKLAIELTPWDRAFWTADDAARFTQNVNDYGLYRVTECEVDSDDATCLLARLERDFESLTIETYDEDDNATYVDEINQAYFEDYLPDEIDDAYFDFDHIEIWDFEIVQW